jgi:hypothetical protein
MNLAGGDIEMFRVTKIDSEDDDRWPLHLILVTPPGGNGLGYAEENTVGRRRPLGGIPGRTDGYEIPEGKRSGPGRPEEANVKSARLRASSP